jgi:hypothetical protein
MIYSTGIFDRGFIHQAYLAALVQQPESAAEEVHAISSPQPQ